MIECRNLGIETRLGQEHDPCTAIRSQRINDFNRLGMNSENCNCSSTSQGRDNAHEDEEASYRCKFPPHYLL